MKKLILSLFFLLVFVSVNAQSIDYLKDNQNFFVLSPNGRYSAGAIESFPAFFYDIVERKFSYCAPEWDRGYFTNAINNEGRVAGAVEHKAAIWEQGGEWTMLPIPTDIIDSAELWTVAYGISNDSKTIVVSVGERPVRHVIYDLQEDGTYRFTDLPIPERDPIYRKVPQWISICGMSGDGNRVVGRFMTEDGFREMPILWERSSENDSVWNYRFLQIDNLIKEGEVTPDYPDENDPNFAELLYDYWVTTQGVETGLYHYMNGASISNNGRFIATKMGVEDLASDAYAAIYGAVIDIDRDTLYIFDRLPNATCLSVTNDGVASLGTPEVEYFRYAYVASIDNPNNVMPLEQYCLAETNGKVNLADYMMYPIDEYYNRVLATGTAVLASEGTGLMTHQWNLIETGWQETFFVLFDGTNPVAMPTLKDLTLYPNPTSGIVNIENIAMTESAYVEVFDVVGRNVYTSSLAESSLDLSHLSVGTYSVRVYQDDAIYSTKLIISK